MNSAFRDISHGFLKSRSVSHSVEFRVKKGDTPASSSSQFSIGVVSAARLGANVAAPPFKFQLVAAPTSMMAAGSFFSLAASPFVDRPSTESCPKTDGHQDRSRHAATNGNAQVITTSIENRFRRLAIQRADHPHKSPHRGLERASTWIGGLMELEARAGIEPAHKGFADLSLTTWVPRLGQGVWFSAPYRRGLEGDWSGRRDLNSRPSPWQGDALPLSYSRLLQT